MITCTQTKLELEIQKILKLNPDLFLSLDTETTGLDLQHKCKPFCVSTCNVQGDVNYWEWKVNPVTRRPKITPKQRRELREHIEGKILIFHNSKFDNRALNSVRIFPEYIEDQFPTSPGKIHTKCHSFQDTSPLSHVFNSSESHKLKDLALDKLDFSDIDESQLKEQVLIACRLVDKYFPGWNKGYDLKGKRQTAMDYWMPKAFLDRFSWVEAKKIIYLKSKPGTKAAQKKIDDLEKKIELLIPNLNKEYACKDAERTILLWMMYWEWLKETYEEGNINYIKAYAREKLLLPVTYRMQSKGITVNNHYLEEADQKVTGDSTRLFKECDRIGRKVLKRKVFNSKSNNKDLPQLLYSEEGFQFKPIKFTPTGSPSVDQDSIEGLLDTQSKSKVHTQYIKALLEAKLNVSASSYIQGYKSFIQASMYEGYSILYPSLNCNGTKTTRFSSSNPNGQNVSKITIKELGGEEYHIPSLRSIFSPLPGKVWYAIDYSQLELRVFAVASQEQSLIDALNNGYDFHEYVACRIFNKPASKITKAERTIAKNTNFAIIFGASAWKINETAGIDNAYELFSGQFPNVTKYMKKIIGEARKKGYVETLFGYPLEVSHKAPYKGVNYIVQGTAGDIVKNSMIELQESGLVDWEKVYMLLQIHDELVFERDKKGNHLTWLNRVAQVMENSGRHLGVITPVSVEKIEDNWAQPQELQLAS